MDLRAFTGQIVLFAGDYAPRDWALCDGRLLQISQFEALFTLIGTMYGGDGVETFALPDFRGRVPIHRSQQRPIAVPGGRAYVSLTEQELPPHRHDLFATASVANSGVPQNAVPAQPNTFDVYQSVPPGAVSMAPQTVSAAGVSMGHENRQPYLAMTYIVCLDGIYPSQ